jgi:hypothetical protein
MFTIQVRGRRKSANKFSMLPALLLSSIFGLGLSGCSGVVSSNNNGGNSGSPNPLAISNVQASIPTNTSFQVSWETNVAANSSIDYGKTASYGSTTQVDSVMVTSHQAALTNLTAATLYHFRVRSTDASSSSAASGDLTFATAGDTTAPTVSITSPAANATLSGSVNVNVTASDNVAVKNVQLKIDNANSGAAVTTAPYVIAVNTSSLSNGNHILTAVASDVAGNSTTSAQVAVKVSNSTTDTTPPTVSMTAPASGATVNGTVSVTASASDNVGVASVQFQLDGANVGSLDTASPYSFSWNTATASNGSHTLRAIAKDAVGNSTTSANATVTVSNSTADTTPPTVSMTAPASGATVSGTVSVTANASDNVGVASVQFQLDGANFGSLDTASPYSVSWNTTTSSNGAHTLRAIAKDAAGNSTTSANVSLTVSNGAADTTTPSVPGSLKATAASSSQINLTWTASTDNVGVTGYNVFRGGSKIGSSPSASFQDGGLAASTSFTYAVSAFDAAGNNSAQSAGASATTQASSGGGIPSALGWFQVPNTTLSSVCPSGASTACGNVIAAWSGGVADPSRNRLVVWGGGHTDYSGNEVYALDLNSLTMNRITNPSTPINSCVAANSDGTPNSRHTYNGLAYIANQDRMYAFAGSLGCAAGNSGIDTWTFHFTDKSWQQMDPTNGTPPAQIANYQGFGDVSDYDPNTGLVFVTDNSSMFTYDYATNKYTNVGGYSEDYHLTGVIDTKRKLFISAGNGQGHKMDIAAGHGFPSSNLAMTNCGLMKSTAYPGLAYDSVQNLIVGWAGGNTVYLYNPDTDSCTTATYSNGPGGQQGNGTNGRFRYFPSLGVFAVVNDWQQNAYTLRLTAGGGTTGGSGPVISGIAVNGITTTGANISWSTDVPATTQVEYGATTAYGNLTTLNSTLSTSHSQALAVLTISTLYHYRVHSKNSSGVESVSGDAAFSTNNTADTTAPTVSMTSPASGATPSGTVTVAANASDNVGVASVQFMLDGANVGSALTAGPYQMTWDTTTAANGSHSLSAVARDAAGNTATATPVSLSVSNSTNAAAAALQDFNARCTEAGVVYCQGFNDATGFQQNVNIYENSSHAGVFPAMDSSTGRSGTSLRIDIPPFQGANSGKFDTAFTGIGGSNSDFYFQVATRISPEMLTNYNNPAYNWPTWKNHGFFSGNTSCTGQMVVTGLHNDGKIPVATTGGCSSNAFYSNGGTPPYLLQQGDYNCSYAGETPTTCFYWPTNTWITFYYHIHLGVLDGNGNYPNTTAEAWVSINGQPYKKWINFQGNYYFVGDGPGKVFDHLELYPYMTGKDSSIGGYPTAHVWFDELIVSKHPIPAPGVPPALP